MMMTEIKPTDARPALARLLAGYSAEVTTRDGRSLSTAGELLGAGTEVFLASLPKDKAERQIDAAVQLRAQGLIPVPHIVARNIPDAAALDELLARLAGEANVDRALVLGGDRDDASGIYDNSLQLLETGLFQKHGIGKLKISAYPEGHPRIANKVLDEARAAKLALIERDGFEVELVSQFCFEAQPVIEFAQRLRQQGCKAAFRVGVAGPADRGTLIKYAMICGVGPSLRALKERQNLAKNMLSGETPEAMLSEIALAQDARPELGISGVHFFTFSSLEKSASWASEHLGS
ncbi:methylenetetrahydrofolate reductase [Hyphomonas sp.]|jgi:methylenetetrahydrofolate reductase (NADPH)|uniref:methylenetetrahydrofolate reductase n=1 Tax=Hyphomonas sp. TaxID=87 RepID=UPI0039E399A5